jgi:hypothetical protein
MDVADIVFVVILTLVLLVVVRMVFWLATVVQQLMERVDRLESRELKRRVEDDVWDRDPSGLPEDWR